MHPIAIQPAEIADKGHTLVGGLVTREARVGKIRFRKGQVITQEDLTTLAETTGPIHVVHLEPGEIDEHDAGIRLATMIRGDGVMQRDPVQSRVNLVATRKGLLRVNAEALRAVNLRPDLGVFTTLDHLPVVEGKVVAGAKISPIAIAGSVLDDVERELNALPEPLIQVKPFLSIRAGVVVTEGLNEKIRDRFEASVRQKMEWYGGDILRFEYVADEVEAVAGAMCQHIADGARMILAAGGHMMDPLDPTQQALAMIGARMIRQGAPAHPGSMFWLGHLDDGDVPIVSLASCSMYSRSTVADLILPRLMAGEQVTNADIAEIGYGGLLDRDMGFRFPPYDVQSVDEPDENE